MGRFTLVMAFLWATGAIADTMQDFLWSKRPLVVLATDAGEPPVGDLKRRIEDARTAFEDRRMVLIEVYPEAGSIEGSPVSAAAHRHLLGRFGPLPETPTVVLIGLDGSEKLHAPAGVDLDRVFDLIDTMPMRQRELRGQ